MRKLLTISALAAAALVGTASGAANASVTLNDDGTGFVGKGDVQNVLGLSNAGIQSKNFKAEFTKQTVIEQSFDWTCVKYVLDKDGNVKKEIRQERANVTKSDETAVVSNEARLKNQITGFNLTGFGQTTTTTEVEGPAVGTCPDENPNPAEPKFVREGDVTKGTETEIDSGFYVNNVELSITALATPIA